MRIARINPAWLAPATPIRRAPAPGFGAELARLLDDRGISQSRFGNLLGCDHSYVNRLVLGTRQPSQTMVQAIIDTLVLDDADAARLAVLGLTPASCHDYLTGLIGRAA